MGILNLSPVAPLEATIRSDSRQNNVGLAVGFQNLYINMLRDAEIILKSIQHRIQHDIFQDLAQGDKVEFSQQKLINIICRSIVYIFFRFHKGKVDFYQL
jgi:methylmalonyl-CoA mutase N-terminal domain/subunit